MQFLKIFKKYSVLWGGLTSLFATRITIQSKRVRMAPLVNSYWFQWYHWLEIVSQLYFLSLWNCTYESTWFFCETMAYPDKKFPDPPFISIKLTTCTCCTWRIVYTCCTMSCTLHVHDVCMLYMTYICCTWRIPC